MSLLLPEHAATLQELWKWPQIFRRILVWEDFALTPQKDVVLNLNDCLMKAEFQLAAEHAICLLLCRFQNLNLLLITNFSESSLICSQPLYHLGHVSVL